MYLCFFLCELWVHKVIYRQFLKLNSQLNSSDGFKKKLLLGSTVTVIVITLYGYLTVAGSIFFLYIRLGLSSHRATFLHWLSDSWTKANCLLAEMQKRHRRGCPFALPLPSGCHLFPSFVIYNSIYNLHELLILQFIRLTVALLEASFTKVFYTILKPNSCTGFWSKALARLGLIWLTLVL